MPDTVQEIQSFMDRMLKEVLSVHKELKTFGLKIITFFSLSLKGSILWNCSPQTATTLITFHSLRLASYPKVVFGRSSANEALQITLFGVGADTVTRNICLSETR